MDTLAPVVVCQDVTLFLDDAGTVSLTSAQIDGGSIDPCGIDTMYTSATSFTCAEVGISPITLYVVDVNGNIDSCVANVTVTDTIAPTATCLADQDESFDANCEFALSDYTTLVSSDDNCSVSTITQAPTPGTIITDTLLVTMTVTDVNGNSSICTFNVRPSDNSLPVVTCPADDTLFVDGFCSVALPDYIGSTTATDNCSGGALTITQSPAVGEIITGAITVTMTATDASGNVGTCSFLVDVMDTIAPSIACLGDQTVRLDDNCQAYLDDYTNFGIAKDNCDGFPIVTQSPAPDSLIEGGQTVEVWLYATDEAGNIDSCRMLVEFTPGMFNEGCMGDLGVADLLTPNGDGSNDTWYIDAVDAIQGCKVMVYNRWGENVFESTNYNNDWDGTYLGKVLPDGAYFYVIECNGKLRAKGPITLLSN